MSSSQLRVALPVAWVTLEFCGCSTWVRPLGAVPQPFFLVDHSAAPTTLSMRAGTLRRVTWPIGSCRLYHLVNGRSILHSGTSPMAMVVPATAATTGIVAVRRLTCLWTTSCARTTPRLRTAPLLALRAAASAAIRPTCLCPAEVGIGTTFAT